MTQSKITTGLNDRPRDAPIGQTGSGLPDDSSQPLDVDEKEVARIREKLLGEGDSDETEAHPS